MDQVTRRAAGTRRVCVLALAALLAGCADGSACRQSDVLAFVDSHVAQRTTAPVVRVSDPVELDPAAGLRQGHAICAAWLRSPNPRAGPGTRAGTQAWLWLPELWEVRKLQGEGGYAVSLLSPVAAR